MWSFTTLPHLSKNVLCACLFSQPSAKSFYKSPTDRISIMRLIQVYTLTTRENHKTYLLKLITKCKLGMIPISTPENQRSRNAMFMVASYLEDCKPPLANPYNLFSEIQRFLKDSFFLPFRSCWISSSTKWFAATSFMVEKSVLVKKVNFTDRKVSEW
jgi:hypothetical protein